MGGVDYTGRLLVAVQLLASSDMLVLIYLVST